MWSSFVKLLQFAEDYAYKKADLTISLLSNAYEHMKTRGLPPEKYVFIPNGVDLKEAATQTELNSDSKNELDEFKKKYRATIAYTGAHGIMNQLDHFILAASRLPEVGFVLLGSGPEKDNLKMLAGDLETKNVLFLDPVPRDEVRSFLKMIDIAYIGLMDSELFEYGISPNKLIDYMVAGKPIIMAIRTKNDPVEKSGCGIKCKSSSPSDITDAIRELAENSSIDELKDLGAKGRIWVTSNLNYDTIIKDFERVIEAP